jgi:two-component system OmpR family response regulator
MAAHILVVDDEPLIRDLVAAHFRRLGFDVAVADDGHDALRVMAVRRTDILITDLQMPGLDGHGLLQRVREEFPLTRAIVLTGYVTLDNVLAALKAGAFSVVAKPITDMAPLEQAVDLAYQVLRGWLDQLSTLQRSRTPLSSRTV